MGLRENKYLLADRLFPEVPAPRDVDEEDGDGWIVSGQSRVRNQASGLVEIKTATETIRPSSKEKLLGCLVDEHLKWTEHLRDNKVSEF